MNKSKMNKEVEYYLQGWQGAKASFLLKAIQLKPTILRKLEVRQGIAKWENMIFEGNKLERKSGIKNMRNLIHLLEELTAQNKSQNLAETFLKEHISRATLFVLKKKTRGNIPRDLFDPPDIIKLAMRNSTSMLAEMLLDRHYADQKQKARHIETLLIESGIQDEKIRESLIQQYLPLERNDIARLITAYICGISPSTFDHKHIARLNKLKKTLIQDS